MCCKNSTHLPTAQASPTKSPNGEHQDHHYENVPSQNAGGQPGGNGAAGEPRSGEAALNRLQPADHAQQRLPPRKRIHRRNRHARTAHTGNNGRSSHRRTTPATRSRPGRNRSRQESRKKKQKITGSHTSRPNSRRKAMPHERGSTANGTIFQQYSQQAASLTKSPDGGYEKSPPRKCSE